MALPGVLFELSEQDKEKAILYVREGGLFKNRLADFLGVSRPTLNKFLEDNPDFFTELVRADSLFCKSLIETVSRKNPIFILRTKYKEEFDEKGTVYDPEEEIRKLNQIIENNCAKEISSTT